MSKGRDVRIINSAGAPFTSAKNALKLVVGGRARVVDEWTIEMIASDRRHQAVLAKVSAAIAADDAERSPRPHTSPNVGKVIPFERPADRTDLITFLPYPQPGDFGRAA